MEHIQDSLKDEIALEGLDGITLEGLWKRLEKRPKFEMTLDEKSKEFFWKMIKRLKGIDMYELEEAREPLFIFNRFDYTDPDSGILFEPLIDFPNHYPHWPINDQESNVLGSCSTYYSRKICTAEAVTCNLQEADEKWGNKLVLVASQALRTHALIGDRYTTKKIMIITNYCLLERIARSRYLGEVTQGKLSLQNALNEDSKNLFYIRQNLTKNNLITKQIFYQKTGAANSNTCGTLLHLTRFYVEKKPRTIFLIEQLITYLKDKPNNMARYDEIYGSMTILNDPFKKLLKMPECQQYINTNVKVPYRQLFPDATEEEWRMKNKEEKQIRVLQLINPNIDVRDIWASKNQEEEEEDEEEQQLVESNKTFYWSSNIPLLNQAYKVILDAGPNGTHKTEMQKLMSLNKLQSRSLFRNLIKRGVTFTYTQDTGRQRSAYIVANKYYKGNKRSHDYNRELVKMRALLAKSESEEQKIKQPPPEDDDCEPERKKQKIELGTESSSGINTDGQIQMNYVDLERKIVERLKVDEGLTSKLLSKEEDSKISYRLLRRANIIINEVKERQVIYDYTKLMKLIKDEDIKEGHNVTIDKRSLLRLLSRLSKDGHIKLIEIRIKSQHKEKSLSFICEPTVTKAHSVIQSAIDQAKIKFSSSTKQNIKKNIQGVKNSYKEILNLPSTLERCPLKYDKTIGKRYGYLPKFMRTKVFHEFLFYLIYGYEGQEDLDQSIIKENFKLSGNEPPEDMPRAYTSDLNFKTFVPPLGPHLGWPNGWALLGDVILRMPITVLTKCFNVVYHIPKLIEFLEDPIKKNYLLKHIPEEIRNALLYRGKYIASLYDGLTLLCYIGLVQLGPHKQKDKDQIFLYLNRRASLYDTIKTRPGYHQTSSDIDYPELNFEFHTLEDIEKYWDDMWNICLHTSLGRYCVPEKISYELNLPNKPELRPTLEARLPAEALELDVGTLPGDRRGAAGVDSGLFTHLRRNWNSGFLIREDSPEKIKEVTAKAAAQLAAKINNDKMSRLKLQMEHVGSNNIIKKKAPPRRRRPDDPKALPPPDKKTPKPKPIPKSRIKKFDHRVRANKKKNPKTYRNYLDEKDKKALQLMSKLRVDWSQTEDNVLLLCKVAALYVSPNMRKFSINNTIIRDVLHDLLPTSLNKTSRACQRRIVYMLKNKATTHSVVLHLEEIRQDQEINTKFGNLLDNLKSSKVSQEVFDETVKSQFKDLVKFIKDKIERPHGYQQENIEIIPDTLEGFYQKYQLFLPDLNSLKKLSRFTPTKNIVDIHSGVLNTVVHSVLSCIADKTNFSYHLIHIYQQYPDDLIRNVFTRIRNDHMVKKNTKKLIKIHDNYHSPPYRFSIAYLYLLQSKYDYKIFSETYDTLKTLESQDEPFQMLDDIKGGSVCCLMELFACNKLNINIELPDQLIALSVHSAENEEYYQKIYELLGQDAEKVVDGNLENTLPNLTSSNMATRLAVYLMRKDGKEFSGDKQHAHDVLVVNSCKVSISHKDSKSIEDLLPKSKVKEVLNDIRNGMVIPPFIKLVSNDDIIKDFDEEIQQFALEIQNYLETKCELGATFCDLREIFPHTGLVTVLKALMRVHAILRSGVTTFHFIHRKFTNPWLVHSYKVSRLQREECLNSRKMPTKYEVLKSLKNLDHKEQNNKNKIDDKNENSNPKSTSEKEASGDKAKIIKEDSNIINTNEPTPMDIVELDNIEIKNKPDEPTPMDIVEIDNIEIKNKPDESMAMELDDVDHKLVENEKNNKKSTKLIEIKESLTEKSNQNAIKDNEEKVDNDVKQESEDSSRSKLKRYKRGACNGSRGILFKNSEEILVSLKPWVRLDGTLNRRVLDRLLGSILGHMSCYPGNTMLQMTDRFSPALQPMHVRELVEILERIGCLELYTIPRRKPLKIFSKPEPIIITPANGTEDADLLIIEVCPDASIKLGLFIGDKNYSTDFLAHESFTTKNKKSE